MYHNSFFHHIHLSGVTPSIGNVVSQFTRLTGAPRNTPYLLEYDGRNYYDTSQTVTNLGKIILPANSLLIEQEGTVWPSDEGKIPRGNIFTSINNLAGDS